MENSRKRTPFIIGFDGTALNTELENHLRKMNPSGVILFKRNIESLEQTRLFIKELSDLLGDIIIAVDHEGGIVNRFPSDCPVPPSPAALNAADSLDLIRDSCKLQAELLAYLGFNMNFAPLVDLALYDENDVIGTRAFSDNPEKVAKYSEICIEEHGKLKIGTTVKHFPTHGRSITDTHYAVGNVVHDNREQLDQDLLPYRRTIGFGVPAIMTAHLSYSILDTQMPASLSKPILNDLLKEKMGFQGLVISDCVEMEGLSRNFTPETIIKKGLKAGVDLFISSFSLKRSLKFQLALKEAFDRFDRENPALNESVANKTSYFLKQFPSFSDTIIRLPTLESAILLHKKALEKQSAQYIAKESRKYHLVELSHSNNKGINAGNQWGALADQIMADSSCIMDKTLIHHCDRSQLDTVIDSSNGSGVTLLILTANGRRLEGYNQFIQGLKKSKCAIHIALLDSADLQGNCGNEWATHGYNACTGKMLAIELGL